MTPRITLPMTSGAAMLALTGCGMLTPATTHTYKPLGPSATTQSASATDDLDRAHQIEALYGKVGTAPGNTPTTQPADPAVPQSVLPIPVRKVPVPAPIHTVAQAFETLPTGADAVNPSAAMGAMTTAPAIVAIEPSSTEPTMPQIVAALHKRIQSSPKTINYALALQLLELADAGHAEDLTPLGISPEDNKTLTDIAAAVQAISAAPAASTSTIADRAGPLVKLTQNFEAPAELKLPKIALASRVDSFGVYTPVENKFPAGKRSVVIIYCEVANFTSEKSDDAYVTRLAQQDTLVTDDGLLVWRPTAEEIEDRCRNQRRDFYLIKKLTLPETLAAGRYTLRMTVTDKLGNKTDTATLPIEIVQ